SALLAFKNISSFSVSQRSCRMPSPAFLCFCATLSIPWGNLGFSRIYSECVIHSLNKMARELALQPCSLRFCKRAKMPLGLVDCDNVVSAITLTLFGRGLVMDQKTKRIGPCVVCPRCLFCPKPEKTTP